MGPSPERHVPRRTCVSCGRSGNKGDFLRIAGRPGGSWETDPAGGKPGRGIYLCREEGCVRQFVRRLRSRRGGGRWKMGGDTDALASNVESWWSSRTE